jgi:hypothetical protein
LKTHTGHCTEEKEEAEGEKKKEKRKRRHTDTKEREKRERRERERERERSERDLRFEILGFRLSILGVVEKSFILGKKERDLRFGCCSRFLSDLGIVEKASNLRERERERERERDLKFFGVFVGCHGKKLANLGICKMSIDHSIWQSSS